MDVDAQTIDAARRGHRPAQGRLIASLQDVWYRVAMGLLGDAEAARDATQETALRFLRQLPEFRGDSRIRTWAIGIAINVARENRRQRQSEGRVGREDRRRVDWVNDPAAEAAAAEEQTRLRDMLADLPERQREAVVLRYFEELSVEQTAAVMECATGTVKATVHQALRAMRQRLSVSRTRAGEI